MKFSFYKRYSLLLRAGAAVVVAVCLKLAANVLGWEVLTLNPLFSGIVAANVFLMGFLLSGVLSDFKESERLPGELAAILETLVDEAASLHERTQNPMTMRFASRVVELGETIHAWFFDKADTRFVMEQVSDLSRFFTVFEPLAQANFIVRMKQEHHALRRILIRIYTIRDTNFISSGYVIAEVTTGLLGIGLILAKIDPFYESLFIVGVIVFLLTYLIFLIRDLDNPFGYYEDSSAEDVSLRPLEDFISRMQSLETASRPAVERRVERDAPAYGQTI